MKEYTVYIHISPSNKYYVGITSKKPEHRWWNGKGYKSNKYFYNAIQKYGWDNFEHEIIAEHLTEQEAKNFEITLISKLKSTNRKYGYNITLGGESNNGNVVSEETRRKLSDSLKGKKTRLGIKQSDKTKRKISETMTGRKHSDDTKKNMRSNSYNKKQVSQYDKNNKLLKTYMSTMEAQRETNIPNTNIVKCCNGKLHTAGGFIWKYT